MSSQFYVQDKFLDQNSVSVLVSFIALNTMFIILILMRYRETLKSSKEV